MATSKKKRGRGKTASAKPAKGRKPVGAAKAAPKPVTDEQLARFMTRGRSVSEVVKAFSKAGTSITDAEVRTRLTKGFDGYDIFAGKTNIAGEQMYVAVPSSGSFKVGDKAWTWLRESSGDNQPYGAVILPADYNHQKIRLVPLDGILYGDPAHDTKRFNAVIRELTRSPNTFGFLNGDVIAEIKGGSREQREQLLLDRAVEFGKMMRPVAHKIMWAQQGCLEARSLAHQGFDPLEHFCAKYDIPYFTEPVYVDIFWGDKLFTLWAMHGHSTAQVKGAKMNALRRPAQMHEYTHFYVMGHVGDSMWNRVIKVCRVTGTGSLEPKEEFQVILGSFKKYFGTRSARRGETPPSNETVVLYLYPNGEHHVKTLHGGKS